MSQDYFEFGGHKFTREEFFAFFDDTIGKRALYREQVPTWAKRLLGGDSVLHVSPFKEWIEEWTNLRYPA